MDLRDVEVEAAGGSEGLDVWQRTCGTGESVEPLTVIDRSVKGVEREGGKMMISVLSMLSLLSGRRRRKNIIILH